MTDEMEDLKKKVYRLMAFIDTDDKVIRQQIDFTFAQMDEIVKLRKIARLARPMLERMKLINQRCIMEGNTEECANHSIMGRMEEALTEWEEP